MIVVKVGGSLFDHPRLGPGLNRFLDPLLRTEPVWLVPGGGHFTDVVRHYDRIHRLGDEYAHWLALRTLSASALFLASFLDGATITNEQTGWHGDGLSILDCYAFAIADDSLPYSWEVTSDSVAARAAVVGNASRLVLLKSVDVPPGTPWDEAATRGWVDPHFPSVVATYQLTVEVVNFRRWLDDRAANHQPQTG